MCLGSVQSLASKEGERERKICYEWPVSCCCRVLLPLVIIPVNASRSGHKSSSVPAVCVAAFRLKPITGFRSLSFEFFLCPSRRQSKVKEIGFPVEKNSSSYVYKRP